MRTAVERPVNLLWMFLLVALVTVSFSPATAGTQGGRLNAARITDEAAKLIQEGRLQDALRELNRALEEDAEYWEAHYQRGRALALLGRMGEARDELVRAGQLNPGHSHTHYLAWLAAYNIEDYETAWDQAIRTHLAGTDMRQKFLEMHDRSLPPEDFALRITAPRIYVGSVEASEIESLSELPYNRDPRMKEQTIAPPDLAVGYALQRLGEAAPQIEAMRRALRETLSRSPYFGLVLRPDQAQYVLRISVDELGERLPRKMEGYLRIYEVESEEVVYFRDFSLRDLDSGVLLYGELERYVNDLEAWRKEKLEQQ